MIKNLVIVESPAKAKTIGKFLGKDYKVMSSYGHIRDLKKKEFSIDIEDNFKPTYEIPSDKQTLVKELKAAAKDAETVWLASDEDREGEAISWHLFEVLHLDPKRTKRIVFHEITKNAILKAIESPRDININLVDAQQARRVLDRIVGFELSPVLWKKVKPSLSAGRVQSVAVRLVVEREKEIETFKNESSYRITAVFEVTDAEGKTVPLKAELERRFDTKEEAMEFLKSCEFAEFKIEDISKKPVRRSPAPPFTTSTLQQEAARKLGYTVSQTMRIAQSLYESGFITYMRTDSVNLSSLALGACKNAILDMMGDKYAKTRQYATKTKGAQEAHEAIRPTYVSNQTIDGKVQEQKLYDLIWKRTIASQMADAEIEKTIVTIDINKKEEKFIVTGEEIIFDGFLRVYKESFDDESEQETENLLPPLKKNEVLKRKEIVATQRFTQHPSRYTEASLVRKLEELGIGRPSTYAPTISTIQQREYVVKGNVEGQKRSYNVMTLKGNKLNDVNKSEIYGAEKAKLLPTDIGIVVNEFLMKFFPEIMDYNFTANVEQQFDEVAEGKEDWSKMMAHFYKGFHPLVDKTLHIKEEHKVGERILGIDPASGKPVSVKIGRYGPVIQVGSADDEEKPRFAQLPKDVSMDHITLEEALNAIKLPRILGDFEGKEISVGRGKFGPYIHHDKTYVSVPKDMDPMLITLEDAVKLIEEKRSAIEKQIIKTFDEKEGLQVLNGRYGPYLSYEKKNYKIPSGKEPAALTVDECMAIIDSQKDKGTKTTRRRKTTK